MPPKARDGPRRFGKGFAPRSKLDAHLDKVKGISRKRGLPYFCRTTSRFMLSGRPLQGITTRLAERFWPTYRLPVGDSGGAGGGRVGGTVVHRDIAKSILTGTEPSHPFARAVLAAMQRMQWTPVSAERAVAMGGHGTAADVIARDGQGNLICVEVKTGMKHAFDGTEHDAGMLAAPLDKYRSHPLHHALLQCVVTSLMFRNTYKKPIVPRVLLVNDGGVDVYRINDHQKMADFAAAAAAFIASRETGA